MRIEKAGKPLLAAPRFERYIGIDYFWPFDGWEIPAGSSAVVEVYPRLWNRHYPQVEGRTADQHDAWVVAEWMRTADLDGRLAPAFRPASHPLPEERGGCYRR